MIGKERVLDILENVISLSSADQTEALFMGEESYLTGFANNYIHRNVGGKDCSLSVRVAIGKKVGSAIVNSFSKDAIKKVVRNAILIAKNQRENLDFVSFAKPEKRKDKDFFVEATANCTPEFRAEYVSKILSKTKAKGFIGSGKFETNALEVAVANSLGVERYTKLTVSTLKSVVLTDTSSGYSEYSSVDVNEIPLNDIIRESVEIAEKSQTPVSIEPGKYEVILTPYALADLIGSLSYIALNARAMNEGMSFLIGQIGKKVVGENVTMYDDGFSQETISLPFDFEGVPKKKVMFFDKGVAKGVVYDTLSAYKEGKKSTGHSLPQPSQYSPYPMNLIMEGGESSKEKMISHVKKGLYVQRFWYTNPMDPRNTVITGMTRDGLFLIENGKITKPVKNMRFIENIATALNNVLELSKERKIIYDMASVTAPYARIKDFTFTGKTEF
ncbi:MAG: TldD/PmbA family protein [Caldisericota bacterium]|nr:TldD/PmbA family protein [Caldisericota bacterium]